MYIFPPLLLGHVGDFDVNDHGDHDDGDHDCDNDVDDGC